MSLTPWLPTVRMIKDGETVEQDTVNLPLSQLIQRDAHLYEKFSELLGKSVLVAYDQPLFDTTITAGQLNVVYFNDDSTSPGLAKALTGFSSSNSNSMYTPNKSNYGFGIVQAVYPSTNTADVYISGLCDLTVALDDSLNGLIERDGSNPEIFEIGPYYLSRRYPGKITKNPSGLPVYIGYAVSRTQFLLSPSVDEFSQFFINYRYNVLDRPAGTPLCSGGIWTIINPVATELGWVPADPAIAPAGAKFYYQIPTGYTGYAGVLTQAERDESLELRKYLPPVPANFIQLTMAGILQPYRDSFAPDGKYSVDEYGIWWYDDTDGNQPWASDIGSAGTWIPDSWVATSWNPNSWATMKGSEHARHRIFLNFAKFNPALRTQLVSSLTAFNRPGNASSNFVKFFSKDTPTQEATTGDLLMKIVAEVTPVGYNGVEDYPITLSSDYTSGRAIAAIKFDQATGKFITTVSPNVAKLVGLGDISVAETSPGSGTWNIAYQSAGVTGFVDSIEPINSRLEFRGLNSYVKFPPPTTTPYGLIGKIILPKGSPNGQALSLALHLFGDMGYGTSSSSRTVCFDMEYSVTTAANGASPSVVTGNTLVNTTTLAVPGIELSLTDNPAAYNVYEARKLTHLSLVIPAAHIVEDSVVNFKLMRVNPVLGGSYTGNIGLLGIYWTIAAA